MPGHKTIMTALAALQKKVLANCACGGSERGFTVRKGYVPKTGGPIPCPDCAPIRELDLCWHEWINTTSEEEPGFHRTIYTHTCLCGYSYKTHNSDFVPWMIGHEPEEDNPDLTTEPYKIDGVPQGKLWIVHCLEVLGEWGEFTNHLWHVYEWDKFVATIADGKLLVDAVKAYMTEREG